MVKIKVIKSGELYVLRKGRKNLTWGDIDKKTPFKDTPAVYQTKFQAIKDLPRIRKLIKKVK